MNELEANLRLTPTERVVKHQRRLEFLLQAKEVARLMDEAIREHSMEGAL